MKWLTILRIWRQRRHYRAELRRLLATGNHLIAELGLTPEQAELETKKPFWRS